MRQRSIIYCCLVLFVGFGFPESSFAYTPTEDPPPADTDHFPSGSDLENFQEALDSLKKFEANKSIGEEIGDEYGGTHDKYVEHPWKGGRDEQESKKEWKKDSKILLGLEEFTEEDFLECFEPRLVYDTCPFCSPGYLRPDASCQLKRNLGYVWEYWWPEWEIEVNNFGISSFNPAIDDRNELNHPKIAELLEQSLRPVIEKYVQDSWSEGAEATAFPDKLRKQPHVGNSHFAGLLPGDQTLVQEGHVYRSYVAQKTSEERCKGCGKYDLRWYQTTKGCKPKLFWYNGYKKGNKKCFYDTLPPERGIVAAWTEEPDFGQYWRIAEYSAALDNKLYQASVPAGLDDTEYWKKRSCGSYRINKWPDIYKDLESAAGMVGASSDALRRICYRGGEQLYPVTGTLMGQYYPLTSAAFLSRRAIELTSELLTQGPKGVPFFADFDRKGDSIDKLQRIYPTPSKCFRIQQVMERNEKLFPKDTVRPDQLGSIRYLYWNKRIGCTCEYRGVKSADELYRQNGWGCQRYPHDGSDNEEISRGHFKEGKLWGSAPPDSSSWPSYSESAGPDYTYPYIGGGK